MIEIIRWVSLAVLWVCIGLNVWTIVRNIRLHKRLEVERKYCIVQIKVCNDFLDAQLAEKLEDENEG